MKKYLILLISCVSIFCVLFTVKDKLSKETTTTQNSYTVGTSSVIDDETMLMFETGMITEDVTVPIDDNTITMTTSEDILTDDIFTTITISTQTQSDLQNYTALNFDNPIGMWFTFMDYGNILLDKSESEFTQAINERFDNAIALGINTVYVHVRSYGDSYYTSNIFPKGKYYNSDFDPLEIMVEIAHQKGLSIHAWINPLRCLDTELMSNLSNEYIIKSWVDQYAGTYINEVNGYWYLNPYYTEVRQLICDGVAEIVENYQVDGIHIDDYFYPTTDESFDVSCFADSNESDLLQFRSNNISTMVKQMYDTIKEINSTVEFGISPQGNIDKDLYEQYADVILWTSTEGYCDYIVPQLYYGFDNSTCPFLETLQQWIDLKVEPSIKLVIGLGTYKIGIEDTWAGDGLNEWIEDDNIVSTQIEYALSESAVDGISIYSYASTFEPSGDVSVIDKVDQERESIHDTLELQYNK